MANQNSNEHEIYQAHSFKMSSHLLECGMINPTSEFESKKSFFQHSSFLRALKFHTKLS